METRDPLDILGQERATEQRDLKAKLESKTEGDDFMWLMSQKRGRRIVWRSLERAGVHRTTFSSDAMAMSFAEGMRQEGLFLTAQIFELCPDRYSEMAAEAKADARAKAKPEMRDEAS